MPESRWDRMTAYAPLSGIAFVVLYVVGYFVALFAEGFLASHEDLERLYVDDSNRILLGGWAGFLGVAAFVWFLGSVGASVRERMSGDGRLATIALGGGLLAAACQLVAFGLVQAAALRGDEDGVVGYGAAVTDAAQVINAGAAPIGFAVLVAAVAGASLRTSHGPAWFWWVSLVVALGLLIPAVSFIVIFLFLAWVVVVSIMLFQANRGAAAA